MQRDTASDVRFTLQLPAEPAAARDEIWHDLIRREHQRETAERLRASLEHRIEDPTHTDSWINATRQSADAGELDALDREILREVVKELAIALAGAAAGVQVPVPPTNLIAALFTAAHLAHHLRD